MRIDVHTHLLPRHWPDLRERYGYPGWLRVEHVAPDRARLLLDDRFFREIEANCFDVEARLRDMHAQNIDVQVLSTVPVMFAYWARAQDSLDFARILNDHIAEVVADRPSRFIGLATVPMQAPALAARELERCRAMGLDGVQIGSHINEWNLDDEDLFEFYEAAEACDMAILVHPWDMMGRDSMPRHWLPWLVGMPAETTRAMCSVLMGGILDRFPKLRFLFSHGGGAFAFTLGRIEHGFHMRPDLCQTRTLRAPSEYLSAIWIDSILHDEAALRFTLDRFGASQIALGSDYPFPLGELEPGKLIDACHFDESTRNALFHGSALRWLNLPASRFADARGVP